MLGRQLVELCLIERGLKCAVVIPTHKASLSDPELASLRNTLDVLSAWEAFIVLPRDVSPAYYEDFGRGYRTLSVLNLEPGHLGSIENYNRMALSADFYRKFEAFDYVLICHLNSWVFRDELSYWMSLGYDYVGAPLFLPEPAYFRSVLALMAPVGGNGGLSLRRTRKMLEVTERLKVRFNYALFGRCVFFLIRNRRYDLLKIFLRICRAIRSDHGEFQRRYNVYEDVMISVIYALLDPSLRICPPGVSARFCLEVNMEEIANNNLKLKLPFGVHGYDKYLSDAGFQRLLRRQSCAYANFSDLKSPSWAMPTNMPVVSIVTVVKDIVRSNRVEDLKRCIESVQRQSYQHIEHLIVDGGSDDGTLEILNRFGLEGAVKVHSSPDNGIWDAMNKGVKLASGEFVNFLNSDDCFCDDRAVQIAVEMLVREKSDWFFSGAAVIRADGSDFMFPTSIYGVFSCLGIVHQTVFVRKGILEAADPFATPYRTKENYLFMLLVMNGFRYSYFPGSLVHYKEGGFSAVEYCGDNLEVTKNDFADYFYELAGKRWRMSRADCYEMFGWHVFGSRGVKHSVRVGFKLRLFGLKVDYFRRLISYAYHHRSLRNVLRRR